MNVIITAIYNRRKDMLENTFRAIAAQAVPCIVIVVDDGSTEDYTELKERYPEFQWVRRESEGWNTPVAAFNLGLSMVDPEDCVYFLSSDVVIPHSAVETAQDYIEGTDGVYCATVNDQESGMQYCGLERIFPMPWFLGCRKRWVEEIGGFDEEFLKGTSWDDNDFSARLLLRNGQMWIDANVVCVHQSHERTSGDADALWNINHDYILKKWGGAYAPFARPGNPGLPPLIFKLKQSDDGVLLTEPRHVSDDEPIDIGGAPETTPFLGVGTGRCGTNSLAKIVGMCGKVDTTQEEFKVPWYDVNEHLGRMLKLMREDRESGIIRGEVSCRILPHVAEARDSLGTVKVVCMHRDKEGFVESALANLREVLRPQNKPGNAAGLLLPTIDAASERQAWEFYWEFYEAEMAKIPEPVFHMNVEDLNCDNMLLELFVFLGIREGDRIFPEHRRFGINGIELTESTEIEQRGAMGEAYWRHVHA